MIQQEIIEKRFEKFKTELLEAGSLSGLKLRNNRKFSPQQLSAELFCSRKCRKGSIDFSGQSNSFSCKPTG